MGRSQGDQQDVREEISGGSAQAPRVPAHRHRRGHRVQPGAGQPGERGAAPVARLALPGAAGAFLRRGLLRRLRRRRHLAVREHEERGQVGLEEAEEDDTGADEGAKVKRRRGRNSTVNI